MSWYRDALLAEFKQADEDLQAGARGAGEEVVYFPFAWADVAKFAAALERDKQIEGVLTEIRDELAQMPQVRYFVTATAALAAAPQPAAPEEPT